MKVELIELLARRKELQEKVDQLRNIKKESLSETKTHVGGIGGQSVEDLVAKVEATVPTISTVQLTHAFDWHAKQLRKVDVAIQKANHTTMVDIDESVLNDYVDPYQKEK